MVYASVITISELLMGVQRADSDTRRQRRSLFVEGIISGVGILDFNLASARFHAQIHAELAAQGQMIGAHDLMIAASARQHGLSILTDNSKDFSRISNLRVIPFSH